MVAPRDRQRAPSDPCNKGHQSEKRSQPAEASRLLGGWPMAPCRCHSVLLRDAMDIVALAVTEIPNT